jgi:Transcriptional Coactivator p15 (PC4)
MSEARKPGEPNAVPIGRFQKNSREVIRAELRTFKGVQLADLRVMALANTVELPTKAGFSIRIEQLPELADLVAKALAEARARGLLAG